MDLEKIPHQRRVQIGQLNHMIEQNHPDALTQSCVDGTRLMVEYLLEPSFRRALTREEYSIVSCACLRALSRNAEPDGSPVAEEGRDLYERLNTMADSMESFGAFLYEAPERWYVFPPSLREQVNKVLARGIYYVDRKLTDPRLHDPEPVSVGAAASQDVIGAIIYFASPWHAAIYGMLIQERWQSLPRPLFRGETKVDRPLLPSYERSKVVKATADRAVDAFTTVVRATQQSTTIAAEAIRAAAQHHALRRG